ncbi:MAG: hypothetical protein RBT64_06195 [Trichloromonas sp.]|jgi:hypothetical protein|nr:hypothetical protein [Trichloromonas sp.]
MISVDELLRRAVEQYRELLEIFASLEGPLARGERERIEERVEAMEACQAGVRELDAALMAQVTGQGLPAHLLPLGREYRELLEGAGECNQALLERARVHQALLAAELAELKGNRTALAGYRLPEENRGRGLSGSY